MNSLIGFILRTLCACLIFGWTLPALATSADYAVIVSDGSPARDRVAALAELGFLEHDLPRESVVLLRQPQWQAFSSALMNGMGADNFYLVLLSDSLDQDRLDTGLEQWYVNWIRNRLNHIQRNQTGQQVVIMDGNDSESFLFPLASTNRILIGSTSSGQLAAGQLRSLESFGSYFFTHWFSQGGSPRAAFSTARNAVSYFQGPTPVLDDTGNGVFNELLDGLLANSSGLLLSDGPYVNGAAVNDLAIVTHSGHYPGNALAAASDESTRLAIHALKVQGHNDASITYLANFDSGTQWNGDLGEVDGDHSLANFNAAVIGAHGADDVLIYLVGHGGDRTFRLNAAEVLDYDEFADQLIDLQNSLTGRLTVVIEACQAGSLIDAVNEAVTTRPIRTAMRPLIVASSRSWENSYFLASGGVSFGRYFFNGILNGDTVAQAHDDATQAIRTLQFPILDGNQDGVSDNADFAAGSYYLLAD